MPKKPTYEELEKRVQELERADFERQQAEAALHKSEEIFKRFLENSPIYIFFKDKNIRSIYLSKNYEQMLGKPLDQILGKTMDELFPSELAKNMIADDKKVLSEGKMVVVDEEFNGRFYTTTKFPIFIDGQPPYLTGYTIDITERKMTEEALRKNEAQLRNRNNFIQTILDNLPIGLAVSFFDKGTASYMNKRYEEIYGWSEEELKNISTFFEKIFPDPVSRKEIKKQFFADMESGDPDRMIWENIQITTKNNRKRFISAKNIPLVEQNLMISTVQDVTKQRQAEKEQEKLQAQLNQAQKMESIGRLAGGVAHDFNNMLGAIIGNTELAMYKLAPDDPLHDTLKEIFNAAMRSAAVARQLIAFARKQAIAPKVLDLNETVEGMLKMLRRLIGEDIDLTWSPGRNVRPIKMDPSQIDQILANLCVNARDAIADVGRVTIETGMVTFDAAYCADHVGFIPGDFCLLAVSDDGCGMDRQTLDKVFEPFFTTKEMGKGTGLGLATVYGIVKQNDGFINIYSEPGRGTTCKIYLPQNETSAVQICKEDSIIPFSHGSETILLVEDEPALLKMATGLLERIGFRVLTANSPGQAISLARENAGEIHLLMTDVVMPKMNGCDLARHLLSLYPNLKCLFMSGYTANAIEHHGIMDEGENFIQKPFTIHDLAIKLLEVLNKRN